MAWIIGSRVSIRTVRFCMQTLFLTSLSSKEHLKLTITCKYQAISPTQLPNPNHDIKFVKARLHLGLK